MLRTTYLNRKVLHHENILWFYVFVNYVPLVKNREAFRNRLANPPDLCLLDHRVPVSCIPYKVVQEIPFLGILHQDAEVP